MDDQQSNVIALKLQIQRLFSIAVMTTNNGISSVERYGQDLHKTCCRNYFCFIIMDLSMPIMDGIKASKKIWALYKSLSQRKEFRHIPEPIIIGGTAFFERYAAKITASSPICGILQKPIEGAKLLAILD